MDAMMTNRHAPSDGNHRQANATKNQAYSLHLVAVTAHWGNKANTAVEDDATDSCHNAADDVCQNLWSEELNTNQGCTVSVIANCCKPVNHDGSTVQSESNDQCNNCAVVP